jgi:hypothetical protein
MLSNLDLGLISASGAASAYALRRARHSYHDWVALGPGGLPLNPLGFLATTALRPLKRDPTRTDIYARTIGCRDDVASLASLPTRRGNRPTIARFPIPHRQLDQFAADEVRRALQHAFERAVVAQTDEVHFQRSHYERHNVAVTLRVPERGPEYVRRGCGEIAHIHPSDGSMHMVFSPSDAKAVIDAGWGERHPIAGVGRRFLPDTYLFVYPPRDRDELSVTERILGAAVRFALSPRRTHNDEKER